MDRPDIKTYLSLLRVHQYLKNLLIAAPLFFGGRLLDRAPLAATLGAFVCFSLIASVVYIINDLKDLEYDRAHPEKRKRPLAAGLISPSRALAVAALLFLLALALGLIFLNPSALGLIGLYLLLNLAYSLKLKHYAVVDVLLIAFFFVLRVFTGGLAAGIPVSHWLVLMAFLLALFLALAKRRDDLVLASDNSGHRPSMDGYNLEFVSAGLIIMAAVTVVCYILYTLSPRGHGQTRDPPPLPDRLLGGGRAFALSPGDPGGAPLRGPDPGSAPGPVPLGGGGVVGPEHVCYALPVLIEPGGVTSWN